MGSILEAAMVICFGASWPLSVYKSIKSRTAKGKSLLFECLICIGYVCGIFGKLASGNITYVFVFYVLNLVMVSLDIAIYIRNMQLDRQEAELAAE